MVAILTADIIGSSAVSYEDWSPILKSFFDELRLGASDWEQFRGDSFQVRLPPEKALWTAIGVKALMKQIKGLDVRIAIGLGEEDVRASRIGESSGTAYTRSGHLLDGLKEKGLTLSVASNDEVFDQTLGLMFKLATDFMDDWSTVSAEMVYLSLRHPKMSQTVMAEHLGVAQPAISQRAKRARLPLVHNLLDYYLHALARL